MINHADIFSAFLPSFFKYVVPVLILGAIIKSATLKGFVGELIVKISAFFSLDKSQYTILNNVTLPTENGSTQIDHIVVSQYGVFVIETKNMKGWISGGKNQKQWTQQIFKHKNKFQNPLHQNYKHTKTLADLLTIDHDNLFSVVVFVGGSAFKTAMPPNVTKGGGYIKFIKSKKEIIFNPNEVASIITAIKNGKMANGIKTHISHINHVRNIKSVK
ncbi:MAG: nuclease-related domain-containing protein [Kiritimatiellae bacterium]|jgi:restriction system protein|nr:nuclease-related domain-containing protein [Kiritimatiellia bacterium]